LVVVGTAVTANWEEGNGRWNQVVGANHKGAANLGKVRLERRGRYFSKAIRPNKEGKLGPLGQKRETR